MRGSLKSPSPPACGGRGWREAPGEVGIDPHGVSPTSPRPSPPPGAERERRVWRAFASAAVLVVSVLATGCGFEPLYGSAEGIAPAELAAIRVAPIADRTGQILHNDLLDRLTPRGAPARPRYVLEVFLAESKRELAIRPDETATRAELVYNAHYTLYTADRSAVIATGNAGTRVSYDILRQEFATLSAEMGGRRQAMRDLSERIRTRLAAALSQTAVRPGS
jgi:LPS-assembly lipoprotein